MGEGFETDVAAGDWPGPEWAVLMGMRGDSLPMFAFLLYPRGLEKSATGRWAPGPGDDGLEV